MSEELWAKYGGQEFEVVDKMIQKSTKINRIKITMGGRDSLYSLVRLPRELADKYSLNKECIIDVIDREDLGGILIKKSN